MPLQLDTVNHACNMISREMRDYQKNLTIHYIVHREGQRTEAFGMAAQTLLSHPASETAMHILQKPKRCEHSALLGTAVARRNLFFGLASRDTILTLCTINADEFNSINDVQRQAYHLAWHALDAVGYHSDPRNRTGRNTEIIIRRRNALELAAANLKADIFSAAISAFHRDKEAARRIALRRGTDAVSMKSMHSPEFYPFPVVLEATEFALSQHDPHKLSRKRIVPEALKIADHVAKSYDDINLKYWMAFAEPAQDMAWRGFTPEQILSAAINTSQNTFVRATGFMIAELSATDPASILDIRESYSPFADKKFNEQLHERMVEQIYQDIIAQGLKQNSPLLFLQMAHRQNEALSEGNVIGWCAASLHAAGEAYESAKEKGLEPEETAHNEFRSRQKKTAWEDLARLGKRIIKSQRQGNAPTMREVEEIAREIDGLKALRQSVAKTMAEPYYQQKPDNANELSARPGLQFPKPAAPETAPILRATPSVMPAHGLAAPGLGGNKTPIVPARPITTKSESEKSKEKEQKTNDSRQ